MYQNDPHNYEPWTMICRGCGHTKKENDKLDAALQDLGTAPRCKNDPLAVVRGTGDNPRRTRVYVAGPILTSGNPYLNVRKALQAGTILLKRGFAPYIPHLTTLWEIAAHEEFTYEDWMTLDIEYLNVCDVLLRLEGASNGADREMKIARAAGKRVHFSLDTLFSRESAVWKG